MLCTVITIILQYSSGLLFLGSEANPKSSFHIIKQSVSLLLSLWTCPSPVLSLPTSGFGELIETAVYEAFTSLRARLSTSARDAQVCFPGFRSNLKRLCPWRLTPDFFFSMCPRSFTLKPPVCLSYVHTLA